MRSNTPNLFASGLGEQNHHTVFVGLEYVAEIMQEKPETLLKWTKIAKFPLRKNKSGEWITDTARITRWMMSRMLPGARRMLLSQQRERKNTRLIKQGRYERRAKPS